MEESTVPTTESKLYNNFINLTLKVVNIFIGLRELASNEMLHWGNIPYCKVHEIEMKEGVSQNQSDSTKGRAIYHCKLPVRLGKCSERYLLCNPITREPIMRTDTVAGMQQQNGNFFFLFVY